VLKRLQWCEYVYEWHLAAQSSAARIFKNKIPHSTIIMYATNMSISYLEMLLNAIKYTEGLRFRLVFLPFSLEYSTLPVFTSHLFTATSLIDCYNVLIILLAPTVASC